MGPLHASPLTGQATVNLRGHGEEGLLHIARALGAGLQEGDLQRGRQVLRAEGWSSDVPNGFWPPLQEGGGKGCSRVHKPKALP